MAKVILQNVCSPPKNGECGEYALNNFNFEVDDHEFTVLTGAPDCGKIAILRLIAGLDSSDSGDISIGQRRVNDVTSPHRDVATVFRCEVLYPHMSVFENMAFGLKLRKIPRAEVKKRVADAAAMLGVTDLLESMPRTLSNGQRGRIALARAVALQPKVFLFEDPLAGLDVESRARLRAEIIHLHQRLDVAIVYATDDQAEAMAMGSRTAVMNRGEIEQVDALAKVYNEPRNLFVAGFLGMPAMNFIHGVVSGNSDRIVFKEDNRGTIELNLGDHPAAAKAVGRKVVLGVRPEDFKIIPADARVDGAAFRALADYIEPLGAETLFHLQTGAHSLVARSVGLIDPSGMGHRVQFVIAPERVHLFDPESTLRIV